MKYFRYFLIGGLVLGLSANQSGSTQPSEGIYPGDLFADVKNLENTSGTKISLSDLKGQKVLVNLWAAYDAPSHRDNVLYANVIEKNNYPAKMISMSFDESESVYERTVMMDKIDKRYQFWIDKSERPNLYSYYRLDKGFRSYLIDEQGKIIAVNPTTKDLDQLLKDN